MKFFIYISIFVLISFSGISQVFEFYNLDTVNRIDNAGQKQGRWVVTGKHNQENCYKENQKVEEGIYKNNKKEGLWVTYYCNEKIKSEIVYRNGIANGNLEMFYENGRVQEMGTWKNNRWVGDYKMYDSIGTLELDFKFDSLGKKICKHFYHGNLALKTECDSLGKQKGVIMEILDDASEYAIPKKRDYPYQLIGEQNLYNKNKQIIKDGNVYIYD